MLRYLAEETTTVVSHESNEDHLVYLRTSCLQPALSHLVIGRERRKKPSRCRLSPIARSLEENVRSSVKKDFFFFFLRPTLRGAHSVFICAPAMTTLSAIMTIRRARITGCVLLLHGFDLRDVRPGPHTGTLIDTVEEEGLSPHDDSVWVTQGIFRRC